MHSQQRSLQCLMPKQLTLFSVSISDLCSHFVQFHFNHRRRHHFEIDAFASSPTSSIRSDSNRFASLNA